MLGWCFVYLTIFFSALVCVLEFTLTKQTSEAPTWALVSSNSAEKERSMEPKSGEIDMQIGKFKITLRNSVDLNLLSDVISVLMRYA